MGGPEVEAEYRRTFGETLVRLRLMAKYPSQPALAAALDNRPSAQTIGRWERGEMLPDVFEIHRLCEVLGVAPEELVNPRELSELERVLLRRGTVPVREEDPAP